MDISEQENEQENNEASAGGAVTLEENEKNIDSSEVEQMAEDETNEVTTDANTEKVTVTTDTDGDFKQEDSHNEPTEANNNDDNHYKDELNESVRENEASMEMTLEERAAASVILVDQKLKDQNDPPKQTKRAYQKRRTPILKWRDVEKEMKSIIYDQVIILWYQLEKKRQTTFQGKLPRQRMAHMILVTLNDPPFLDRQRIYSIINKHTKSCEEIGMDPTDCTHLPSIPKIFEALDDLQSLIKEEQKYEQQRNSKSRSSYSVENDEDDDNYASSEFRSSLQKKKMKMTSREMLNKKGAALGKLKEKVVAKGKKTFMKPKGPTTSVNTGTETGVVTKEVKNMILKKAVDLYLAKKDEIESCTVSSGIPRTLVSEIIVSLGQPRWLTRNDVYTAIHTYNKRHSVSSNSAVRKVDTAKKDSSIKTKTATFSATNTTVVKREKLTSTQKKARLEEAIEIATNSYAMARKLAHPNIVQEGVLASIIHSAIAKVRLPPNFSVLITPISIRTRLARRESDQNQMQHNVSTGTSTTTTTVAGINFSTSITTPSALAGVNSTLLSASIPASTTAARLENSTTTSTSAIGNPSSNEANFL
jgi:hypothetical protein